MASVGHGGMYFLDEDSVSCPSLQHRPAPLRLRRPEARAAGRRPLAAPKRRFGAPRPRGWRPSATPQGAVQSITGCLPGLFRPFRRVGRATLSVHPSPPTGSSEQSFQLGRPWNRSATATATAPERVPRLVRTPSMYCRSGRLCTRVFGWAAAAAGRIGPGSGHYPGLAACGTCGRARAGGGGRPAGQVKGRAHRATGPVVERQQSERAEAPGSASSPRTHVRTTRPTYRPAIKPSSCCRKKMTDALPRGLDTFDTGIHTGLIPASERPGRRSSRIRGRHHHR